MTVHGLNWHPKLLLVVLALGLGAAGTAAPEVQAQAGVRSVGALSTGGGASALSAPTAALYMNPANIRLGDEDTSVELRFFDVRAYSGGGLIQFQPYETLFTQDQSLTSTEAEQTINDWFGGSQQRAVAYSDVVPFSVTYRPTGEQWAVGFGVRIRGTATTSLNGGFANFVAQGTGILDEGESSRTVPIDARYRLQSTIDLTGAFSYEVDGLPLWVGASPRVVFGTGYADAELDSELTVQRDSSITHSFDYTARAAGLPSSEIYSDFGTTTGSDQSAGVLAGIGAGIDLGATYQLQPGLFVSASITDLGVVGWGGQPQTITPSTNELRFTGFDLNLQRLENEFDDDVGAYLEHQADSIVTNTYEDVDRNSASFSSGLPTALHVNGTWENGRYILNGGASVGLNEQAGAVSSTPTVYAGGEAQFGPVPLRAGVRLGGDQALTLAGGFGLDAGFYQFDLGISVSPNSGTLGSGAYYAVGLSMATVRF